MKKLSFVIAFVAILSVFSCKNDDLNAAKERNMELEGDVTELIATQDSLLVLVNDITEGMRQIKELEQIVSDPNALRGETPSRKEQIKNDILALQQALQERRERLDELEKKLASMTSENEILRKTIVSLKEQIDSQQAEILNLNECLAAANMRIKELDRTVAQQSETISQLNEDVASESTARENAEREAEAANNELNAVYYCIGTAKELKDNKVTTSGGFLRGSKVSSDLNLDYFTKADKRTLTSINTHAKKIDIKTKDLIPEDSYTVTKVNNEMVINIIDPDKFWSRTDYLVIQTK